MFRITPDTRDDELVLKLEGCLAGPWVRELDEFWRDAARTLQGRHIRVDLREVCHVDAAGRELMTLMYLEGVRFIAKGCVMPEVVREIEESVHAGRRS
jgi:anti-anti-sigma regulatory factor